METPAAALQFASNFNGRSLSGQQRDASRSHESAVRGFEAMRGTHGGVDLSLRKRGVKPATSLNVFANHLRRPDRDALSMGAVVQIRRARVGSHARMSGIAGKSLKRQRREGERGKIGVVGHVSAPGAWVWGAWQAAETNLRKVAGEGRQARHRLDYPAGSSPAPPLKEEGSALAPGAPHPTAGSRPGEAFGRFDFEQRRRTLRARVERTRWQVLNSNAISVATACMSDRCRRCRRRGRLPR